MDDYAQNTLLTNGRRPLEVAVRAFAGAVMRALRSTGVGRGAITYGCGALTDPSLAS